MILSTGAPQRLREGRPKPNQQRKHNKPGLRKSPKEPHRSAAAAGPKRPQRRPQNPSVAAASVPLSNNIFGDIKKIGKAYEVVGGEDGSDRASSSRSRGLDMSQHPHEVFTMMPADSTFKTYDSPHTAAKR